MYNLENLASKIRNHPTKIRIVFPEGENAVIRAVANRLAKNNIVPILVFKNHKTLKNTTLSEGIQGIALDKYPLLTLGEKLYTYRKDKLSLEQANKLVGQANYFSIMLVKEGMAEGMVGGIDYPTKDILLPALQIIRTRPGVDIASSVFLMVKNDSQFIFTDCALNLYPNALQLAQIGKLAYEAAQLFNFEYANMVFLSYSSHGSGKGEHVDVVKQAVKILQDEKWNRCAFDGELQFDSAVDLTVRSKKAPDSTLLAKPANIYVFPNLDSGNIGYKILQRLGGFNAIGPIVLGLAKPVNDLSRGASIDDVYQVALINAYTHILNLSN